MTLLVGVFVGGRGSRLGGVAKGLLKAPLSEQTLLERLLGEIRAALGEVPLVLVGEASAYPSSLPAIADAPPGVGPIGGLGGLLRHAQESSKSQVITLACDLPYLRASLISRLAKEHVDAAALVAHLDGVRNPLVARYDVAHALPAVQSVVAAGQRALQAVLDSLDARLLPLSPEEASTLVDWDTPEDVRR